jgi:hypothetical protein
MDVPDDSGALAPPSGEPRSRRGSHSHHRKVSEGSATVGAFIRILHEHSTSADKFIQELSDEHARAEAELRAKLEARRLHRRLSVNTGQPEAEDGSGSLSSPSAAEFVVETAETVKHQEQDAGSCAEVTVEAAAAAAAPTLSFGARPRSMSISSGSFKGAPIHGAVKSRPLSLQVRSHFLQVSVF